MPLTAEPASAQLEPLYTRMELAVVLKCSAPVTKASPSLSTVGLELLAPKYLSSNESKLAAAAVADVAALLALVDASDALVVAVDA